MPDRKSRCCCCCGGGKPSAALPLGVPAGEDEYEGARSEFESAAVAAVPEDDSTLPPPPPPLLRPRSPPLAELDEVGLRDALLLR
jgi:hypothetical protein